MTIPNYVDDTPTEKRRSADCCRLIGAYYSELWKQLRREGKSKAAFNEFLLRIKIAKIGVFKIIRTKK